MNTREPDGLDPEAGATPHGRPEPASPVLGAVRRFPHLPGGATVLVAVSGGPDSTALLLALHALAPERALTLRAAHVHHGLRGEEADADEAFCLELTDRLRVPLQVVRLTPDDWGRVSHLGTQEGARHLRLAALRRMMAGSGSDLLALGHTATDRVETVLMNILRGSGLEGLAAMPARRGPLIRPLIRVWREEAAEFCRRQGATPRQDSSNRSRIYLRNRIRQELLPLIRTEYAPGVCDALLRLAELAEQEREWTQGLVSEALGRRRTSEGLVTTELAELPVALQRRVLRQFVEEQRGSLHGVEFQHVEALRELALAGREGVEVALPGGTVAYLGQGLLRWAAGRGHPAPPEAFAVRLPVPGEAEVAAVGVRVTATVTPVPPDVEHTPPNEAYLDAARVGRALTLRSWRPGDRWRPLGMAGSKKLQDSLTDARTSRAEKARMVLAVAEDGTILWLVGHRIAEEARVTAATEAVVHLRAEPL